MALKNYDNVLVNVLNEEQQAGLDNSISPVGRNGEEDAESYLKAVKLKT